MRHVRYTAKNSKKGIFKYYSGEETSEKFTYPPTHLLQFRFNKSINSHPARSDCSPHNRSMILHHLYGCEHVTESGSQAISCAFLSGPTTLLHAAFPWSSTSRAASSCTNLYFAIGFAHFGKPPQHLLEYVILTAESVLFTLCPPLPWT